MAKQRPNSVCSCSTKCSSEAFGSADGADCYMYLVFWSAERRTPILDDLTSVTCDNRDPVRYTRVLFV